MTLPIRSADPSYSSGDPLEVEVQTPALAGSAITGEVGNLGGATSTIGGSATNRIEAAMVSSSGRPIPSSPSACRCAAPNRARIWALQVAADPWATLTQTNCQADGPQRR